MHIYMYISILRSHNHAPMPPSMTKYYQNMITWQQPLQKVTNVVPNDPGVAPNPGTRVQKPRQRLTGGHPGRQSQCKYLAQRSQMGSLCKPSAPQKITRSQRGHPKITVTRKPKRNHYFCSSQQVSERARTAPFWVAGPS